MKEKLGENESLFTTHSGCPVSRLDSLTGLSEIIHRLTLGSKVGLANLYGLGHIQGRGVEKGVENLPKSSKVQKRK